MALLGTALVTGAAQGIGRAIALRLANDGYDIALIDLPTNESKLEALKAEITDLGRKVLTIMADVSSEASVISMVAQTVQDLGGLDVMVANAGICKTKNFIDTELSDWEEVFAVNVRGVFLCYKYAAKQMLLQGRGGRIIGASSLAGKQGVAITAAYSSSKFAVRGLTQCAAAELAPHGITVNAYAPGAIKTDMLVAIHREAFSNLDYNDLAKRFSSLGRFGTPEEIASLVSFIASKESGYITGQTITINGGGYFD